MWNRLTPLAQHGNRSKETWIRTEGDSSIHFPMDLYMGKKTNLLKLKKNIVESVKSKVEQYRSSRRELYQGEKEYVSNCPVTGVNTEECSPLVNIYGAEYVVTPDTGHVYVKNRPTTNAINNFYLNNVTYAATYTDKSGAEFRLNSIAVPWVNWTKEVYYNCYNRYPRKILDVGSGAGHFVEACRRDGIDAHGIELSNSSREFAKEMWGIELDGRDFLEVTGEYNNYDVVTFWGLLEHTPNPGAILGAATKVLGNNGMVISKLPRWTSLSSAAQILNNDSIIRHMDPMGHIMLFSDASAAELYYKNGFKPITAWYYGMDIYEMLMQLGTASDSYELFLRTGELQMELQQFIDEKRFSDGLTLVGTPLDLN